MRKRSVAAKSEKRALPRQIGPVEPGPEMPAAVAAEVNEELAIYNSEGNFLALWSVVNLCLQNRLPLPAGVADFVALVASKLTQLSLGEVKGARNDVSDLVLGTRNDPGGRSVFRRYKDIKDQRRLLSLLDRYMNRDVVKGGKSQASVFKKIAEAAGLSTEYVKGWPQFPQLSLT